MAFQIENVDWKSGKNRLSALREQVFVLEWNLPRETEFDDRDSDAFHVLINDDKGLPIASGRLTKDGEIGRIAVKNAHRTLDVYQTLFSTLLSLARTINLEHIIMVCDLHSVDKHKAMGFEKNGTAYMEAGIPRQQMTCPIERFRLPDVSCMH